MDGRLRLERQPLSGWRHFIGDEDIHCGDIIEVYTGGKWVAGRYEAEGLRNLDRDPIAYMWIDEATYIKLHDGFRARLPRD